MQRIIVIPVSGYLNRLQAIASTALLAEDLGVRFDVCWLTDAVVPVGIERVLSSALCDGHAVEPGDVFARTDIDPLQVPLYLNRVGEVVTLAGHDRGEQVFMPELLSLLQDPLVNTLVIKAGGHFYLPISGATEAAFRGRRHAFYRPPLLREDIEATARDVAGSHEPYLGLHLRYTDRAHQAPSNKDIMAALTDLAQATGVTSVFIAGDNPRSRDHWTNRVAALGLSPWSIPQESFDRSVSGSEFAALVDWRVLSQAQASVYFAESSFAVEAAVASTGFDVSRALVASSGRAARVRFSQYVKAAITYPRRHGWVTKP